MLRPSPFTSTGRVHTFQNSATFCVVKQRSCPERYSATNARLATRQAGWLFCTVRIRTLVIDQDPHLPAIRVHAGSAYCFIVKHRRVRKAISPFKERFGFFFAGAVLCPVTGGFPGCDLLKIFA